MDALSITDLTVDYGRNRAVDSVCVDFRSGAVHGLLGANGSGKSSLLKALAGVNAGAVRMSVSAPRRPEPVNRLTAGRSRALGLRFVHQDLGLVPEQSVLENIYLSVRPPSVAGQVRWRLAATRAKATLTTVGLDVATGATVAELRPSERVLLAVARALIDLPETGGFLFLDEPTAGLDEREARELLEHVRGLAQSTGVGVVLVTHRLRDVERFADDVTVLRDGRVVERMTRDDLDLERIVVALGGRLDPAAADSARRVEPTVGASQDGLVLRRVSGHAIRDLTVTVAPGEVIGFTGLEGSGKDEIIDLLYGVTAPRRGSMSFDGAPLVAKGPAAAVRRGIGLVPADRVGAGGIPEMTIQENLFLSGVGEFVRFGTFRRGAARRTAAEALSRYHVVPDDPAAVFASLSGGNQQKVIVGRWLRRDLRLLLLHEPTAGVDVGARTFLWSEIREAARRGVTVVVATSDIAEAAELCDRVAVLVDGRLTAVLAGAERTPDRVLAASLGETESTAATDSHGSP